MHAKKIYGFWISLFVIALFAGLSVTRAQTGAKADVVTAIGTRINMIGRVERWRVAGFE